MGSGIAQVLAQANIKTLLFDSNPNAVKKALERMDSQLKKLVEKGKLQDSARSNILSNISAANTISDLADVELVVEAIVENPSAKFELFKNLSQVCGADTILATNTSSISITKIAATVADPTRVIGLHFMNPVPIMKLVEVIRGLQTSDQTYNRALALVSLIGKTAVTAKCDYPGFVVNRILMPMLNEAFFALMEGIASAEDIDQAMKLGTNQPMGPLELADFVGLDTCLAICQILHTELGDDKYRPCPLMTKYVEAGWLGRKTGRGVYQY